MRGKFAQQVVWAGIVLGLSAHLALAAAPAAEKAPKSPSIGQVPLVATYSVTQISLEAAQLAAQAALANCRASGYQVAVAVVDRSGNAVVVLRDRFAGAHTVDTAINKAWTAASFKISTTALGVETLPSKPSSGIRKWK